MIKKNFKAILVISGVLASVLKSFYQIPLTWSKYYGRADHKLRRQGGGGQKSPILRRHSLWMSPNLSHAYDTHSVAQFSFEQHWLIVIKSEKWADVVYGWTLRKNAWLVPQVCEINNEHCAYYQEKSKVRNWLKNYGYSKLWLTTDTHRIRKLICKNTAD